MIKSVLIHGTYLLSILFAHRQKVNAYFVGLRRLEGLIAKHPDLSKARLPQPRLQLRGPVRPLSMRLGKAAIQPALLPAEEGQIHLHNPRLRVVGICPKIGHLVPLLAEKAVAQHRFQLIFGRYVESQRAAGANRPMRRAEKAVHLLV